MTSNQTLMFCNRSRLYFVKPHLLTANACAPGHRFELAMATA